MNPAPPVIRIVLSKPATPTECYVLLVYAEARRKVPLFPALQRRQMLVSFPRKSRWKSYGDAACARGSCGGVTRVSRVRLAPSQRARPSPPPMLVRHAARRGDRAPRSRRCGCRHSAAGRGAIARRGGGGAASPTRFA